LNADYILEGGIDGGWSLKSLLDLDRVLLSGELVLLEKAA
jgi:hypothetical protein